MTPNAQAAFERDYVPDMDWECINICNALNELPGIQTTESCCGHGDHRFRVFFRAQTIGDLLPIVQCSSSSDWWVETRWTNGNNTVLHMLEGPKVGSCPGGE